jgi:hypothetical protein
MLFRGAQAPDVAERAAADLLRMRGVPQMGFKY